jgi:hypothetical protein
LAGKLWESFYNSFINIELKYAGQVLSISLLSTLTSLDFTPRQTKSTLRIKQPGFLIYFDKEEYRLFINGI